MSNHLDIFLKRMNDVMDKKNITEDELFSKAKFTDEQIESIKQDNFETIGLQTASQIAYVLDVPLDYLAGIIDTIEEKPLEELYRQMNYALLGADDSESEGQVIMTAFTETLEDMVNNDHISKDDFESENLEQIAYPLEEVIEIHPFVKKFIQY
jgi:transcriptional regulator with XRE-family HTH domain